ncbi:MAG TPA: hypothetical protein VIX73_38800 [Kofleriaceae bacterium]
MRFVPLALMAVVGGTAHADGERALSAGLGWATFSALGKPMGKQAPPTLSPDIGGMLAMSYEYSVSSDVALRAELAGGVFHGGGQPMQSQTSYASLGDAGAVFRFDVLKVVPYLFGGLGGVVSGGGPLQRGADFVLVVGGGVDWLYNRERSLGLEARIASFGGDITVATFGVRGTLRWGDL